MLSLNDLSEAQNRVVDRLYEHDETLLVAKMGAGKTVVTLTALSELLADGVIHRALVIAPLKVCQSVWAKECEDWAHLQGLTVADGSGGAQRAYVAIKSSARIVCINFENLPWLFRTHKKGGGLFDFDALVIDETTKLKKTGGTQYKALRPHLKEFKWRLGMTGTPVSESWQDLFGQMLLIDGGERLGTRKDGFLRRYFYPTDYKEYNWEPFDWAPKQLAEKVADVVYTMADYRGELPPLYDIPLYLPPPPDLLALYHRLKADMVVEEGGAGAITADTAAVLSNKLMQLANGFLYDQADEEGRRGVPVYFDDYKIRACAREVSLLLESNRQVVICYWFEADLIRLLEYFPGCKLSSENIAKWNRGDLDVLLLHPKSAGHGLNLASGGSEMIWIGPIWSRDQREQTIARLWRRGQREPVNVRTLIAGGTIDELVSEREQGKKRYEELFKQHIGG